MNPIFAGEFKNYQAMFNSIVRFSIHNKLFVGLFTLFLLATGLYSMMTLPVDAVPDITNNQVQIVTISPTLAPQEVEQLITFPIEIAMSNIMNVEEIRSVSCFGLSLVTVVFKESVPTLEARQLINEQIQTVAGEIPSELGVPELMPITTGLGEIYQYVLKVAPGYEDRYDAMELRTIQDWIVKRQLSGIPGIVEINSFGGYMKQYEVAVNPDALYAVDLTIGDVFEALKNNNQNTGGSYIEKVNRAYYIRSEGMINDLNDIEQIVIANRGGIPVHIDEIGTVRLGAPKRFGAMTMDGQGECVGGIAMMLKGANANVVTREIEARVERVQKLLPEGVSIEPYLNRSELVTRNISTVIKNLIEGALIVFVVLILFFGKYPGRPDRGFCDSPVYAVRVYPDALVSCFCQSDEFRSNRFRDCGGWFDCDHRGYTGTCIYQAPGRKNADPGRDGQRGGRGDQPGGPECYLCCTDHSDRVFSDPHVDRDRRKVFHSNGTDISFLYYRSTDPFSDLCPDDGLSFPEPDDLREANTGRSFF